MDRVIALQQNNDLKMILGCFHVGLVSIEHRNLVVWQVLDKRMALLYTKLRYRLQEWRHTHQQLHSASNLVVSSHIVRWRPPVKCNVVDASIDKACSKSGFGWLLHDHHIHSHFLLGG